jgi:uncharacterized protein
VIKVVLDTNVFVSSFFGGHPREIVNLWKTGEITLCLSKEVLDEYVEVLGRVGLQNEKELGELLGLFARGFHVQFTAKTPDLRIVEGDPDDDKFIECAVALNAKVVISGDKALRAIEEYMGIQIFTPREFLEIFIKPQR